MSPRTFRIFLGAETVLLAVWMGLGALGDPFLPEGFRGVEFASASITSPALQQWSLWLHLIAIVTWLSAIVLLWMLRPIGRILYAASVVLGIVEIIPVNFLIFSGPLIALTQLTTMVSAVILIAPFLPPLREWFRAPRGGAG
jgi:hypothetical protein